MCQKAAPTWFDNFSVIVRWKQGQSLKHILNRIIYTPRGFPWVKLIRTSLTYLIIPVSQLYRPTTGRRRNMRRPESYYFPYHVFGDNSEESLNDKNSFKVSSWREHFGQQWSSSTGYHNTIKPLLPSYCCKTELAFGLLTYHQMAPPKVTRCFLLGYQECKVNWKEINFSFLITANDSPKLQKKQLLGTLLL